DFKNGEYGPDIVSDYACDFIKRKSKSEKPFFVYYPMMLPHWPFEPTPDSEEWDPKARVDDKTEKGANMKSKKFFIDMVHYVDKIVGKIVAEVEASGDQEDTLIIFTGDNGTYESIVSQYKGNDWRGGKSYMTDNGTRNTLIANWPAKINAGGVNNDLVDFSDFLPTLAEVGDVEVPEKIHLTGRSFAPQLSGEKGNPRDSVYCWYFRNGKPVKGGKKHSAGEFARDKKYKLYQTGEFYDVENDFYEQSKLSTKKLSDEQKSIRIKLQAVIDSNTRQGFYSENTPE
ncbi:sulfatase-like hydrolase/transferase, partial [Planctomicrobium sp.]|nr:sulfatase-like hydrolase/transferase [Planctomicrobium sp.]